MTGKESKEHTKMKQYNYIIEVILGNISFLFKYNVLSDLNRNSFRLIQVLAIKKCAKKAQKSKDCIVSNFYIFYISNVPQ